VKLSVAAELTVAVELIIATAVEFSTVVKLSATVEFSVLALKLLCVVFQSCLKNLAAAEFREAVEFPAAVGCLYLWSS
jgi:hypothetical protein